MTNDKLEKITERIDKVLYFSMKTINDSEIVQNIKTVEELLKLESKILVHYCLCKINSPRNIVRLRSFLNRMVNLNNSDADFETKLEKLEIMLNEINMR